MAETQDPQAALDRVEQEGAADAFRTELESMMAAHPEPVAPDPLCPMPVLRRDHDAQEPGGEAAYHVVTCGAALILDRTIESGPLGADRADAGGIEWWEVKCLGGHVILMPDDEGNGDEVPYGEMGAAGVGMVLTALAGPLEPGMADRWSGQWAKQQAIEMAEREITRLSDLSVASTGQLVTGAKQRAMRAGMAAMIRRFTGIDIDG